jgi:STE24 endopeptidase
MATATLTLKPASPDVKRYQRDKLLASLASLLVSLLVLAALATAGPRMDAAMRSTIGDSRWLRLMVTAAIVAAASELVTLPISFWSGFVLEHRHGLSTQTATAWLWRQVKGWLVGGPIGLALLLGLYAVLWEFPTTWWLWATVGWLLATLVLGRLMPVIILPLFLKVTPLEDADLQDRLRRLAEGTGLQVEGVYRLHLSATTRKANAALAGLGKSRRVLLGDTLLENFTPAEIGVVFAHEVGHHVHRHLPKLIAWSVLTAAGGFLLIDWLVRALAPAIGYGRFDDPAALPLVLLTLGLFGCLVGPLGNALSRRFERQCDRYALERTGDADTYRSAFIKLATLNKSDPDPHALEVWLLHDHPPIRQRLAMAERARNLAEIKKILLVSTDAFGPPATSLLVTYLDGSEQSIESKASVTGFIRNVRSESPKIADQIQGYIEDRTMPTNIEAVVYEAAMDR